MVQKSMPRYKKEKKKEILSDFRRTMPVRKWDEKIPIGNILTPYSKSTGRINISLYKFQH